VSRPKQPSVTGRNGSASDSDGEPRVYVILLLVPEEARCPSAESIIKATGIHGVCSYNGHPIAIDAAPPQRELEPVKRPRRRPKAASVA
jgi:hypothetical protein